MTFVLGLILLTGFAGPTQAFAQIICGTNSTNDNGNLTSPGYPDNHPNDHKCTSVITVTNGQWIKITVNDLHIQVNTGRSTCFDKLTFRDDYGNSYGTYCKPLNDYQLILTDNTAIVIFESDGIDGDTHRGFSLSWSAVNHSSSQANISGCGNDIVRDSGQLSSPNYPQEYPINLDCSNKISVDGRKWIQMTIIILDSPSPSCTNHHLTFHDMQGNNYGGKYCGDQSNVVFNIESSIVIIRFLGGVYDYSMTGFTLSWQEIDNQNLLAIPPTLKDIPCGISCNVRERNCSEVEITALDWVANNAICGINVTGFGNNNYEQYPASSVFNSSKVKCRVPEQNAVVTNNYMLGTPALLTYMVYLSNNGQNFSSSGVQYTVYDSKCMTCPTTSSNCEEPMNCTLKERTCYINGYCFYAYEGDPNNTNCMLCDPVRSTSKFMYRRGYTEGCQDGAFSINCNEMSVTGFWEKEPFAADDIQILMKDSSCNDTHSNVTHVWMIADYKDCGSSSKVSETTISYEVTATLYASYVLRTVMQRRTYYTYKMRCIMQRTLDLSSSNNINATVESSVVTVNVSGDTGFNAMMSIYTSDSFQLTAVEPYIVGSSQTIFIGIKETNNNELLRFVVNRCYATATSDLNGIKYTFFDGRCPLDASFKIVSKDSNNFNFQIEAFRFLQDRKSVYMHCQIFVCPIGAQSDECKQECVTRQRRSVEDHALDEITVTSPKISYRHIKTCEDIACPSNAHCVSLRPAVCVCNDGLVLNFKENRCSSENMFKVYDLHIQAPFVSTYSDTSSNDFLMLANWAKQELIPLFKKNNNQIVGIKVTGARPGSIVLELLLLYANDVTSKEANEIFISTIFVSETEKQKVGKDSILTKVKDTITPKIVVLNPHLNNEEEKVDSKIIIITTIVVFTVIIFGLLVIIITMHRRRREPTSTKSVDNHGFNYDWTMENKM